MAQCPFINKDANPDRTHYEPINYPLGDGSTYRFYYHDDGQENGEPKACQFCQHIGRTYDFWACLNEWEWQRCPHLRANVERLSAEVRESLPFLIYPTGA